MQKKLRMLCATLFLSLLMTVPAFAADISFSDVPTDAPYAEAVDYLVEQGITNGTGADTFSPDAPMTVRQWSVMLCRAYGLPVEGDTWANLSDCAMVQAYRQGWLYETVFADPDARMCRGALYDSALAAAGVPVYDNTLYGGAAMTATENTMRVAAELKFCDSAAAPLEIVTRAETAQLLHAILTKNLTVEAPAAPVKLDTPDNINANDFLLELRKIPEPILAEFDRCGWTYSIDFDHVAEIGAARNVSCIGVTDYTHRTIYVTEAEATLHEFGHFLDKVLGFPTKHEQLFREEAANSILRDYAKTSAHEYFAEYFTYWLTHRNNANRMTWLRESTPQTYAYFEALEAENWSN